MVSWGWYYEKQIYVKTPIFDVNLWKSFKTIKIVWEYIYFYVKSKQFYVMCL